MSSTIPASAASPTKPSGKNNRLPAPSLFVGPPSRGASQLSLARVATESGPNKGRDLQKGALLRPARGDDEGSIKDGAGKDDGSLYARATKPSEKSIVAKWREMQSTLNEVELTAQSTTHVFGGPHAAALEDLRNAQIALARSWGRGNEEQAATAHRMASEAKVNISKKIDEVAFDQFSVTRNRPRADTETSASTTLSDESQLTESESRDGKIGRTQLEDEAAKDIRRASERRAANEAYFRRVDQNVKEVVDKLEKVAEAMRGVEAESRSLWSQSDLTSSDSPATERPMSSSATGA